MDVVSTTLMDANDTMLPEGVIAFDIETTSFRHPNHGKHDPTPFNPKNRMLYFAAKKKNMMSSWAIKGFVPTLVPFKVLVGHNIKFDLLWARKTGIEVGHIETTTHTTEKLWSYIVHNATVWDTQLAEYLCSGQTMMFPSLEECCAKRGIPIKKSLDLGPEVVRLDGDLSLIPEAEFEEYVRNDVEMTAALFNAQIKDPYVVENFDWFMAQMEALLAETEIEWNGTAVNMPMLMSKKLIGQFEMERLEREIKTHIESLYPGRGVAAHVNIGSPANIAAILHGGTIKWEEREEIGFYKSGAKIGQPRYKVHKKDVYLCGACPALELTEGGEPSTSDETLQKLLVKAKHSGAGIGGPVWRIVENIVSRLIQYRELAKAVGTTLTGIAKFALPDEDGEFVVRPQMNNTSTATGRRSSSKPNGQNYPSNDPLQCKEVLGPRKRGRTIVSIDFKQAEIMGLAYVANDLKLMEDIIKGVDIHTKMGEKAFPGRKVTKEERRIVKTVVFGTIYGGGVETLAAQAGVTTKVAQAILDALADTYPASWAYMGLIVRDVQNEFDRNAVPTDMYEQTPHGTMPVPRVIVSSVTGRRYAFRGYWRNFRKCFCVSMTQPKNYFIQGFATGDLVPICIGRVWRWLEHAYPYRVELIGAIHDSIVFEVDNEILDKFIVEVIDLISEAGEYLHAVCHMDRPWTMPVKCDVETGTTLGDLKLYEQH